MSKLTKVWRRMAEEVSEHPWHWFFVAVAMAFAVRLSHYFEENEVLATMRYRVFEWIQERSPRPLAARDTLVVLIDDEAYYLGEPAGRRPINRRYISRLVAALAELNPALIALDFDLRSPEPTGTEKAVANDGTELPEYPEYVEETRDLLFTLKDVSEQHHVPIVLPATIARDGKDFVTTADIYSGFDFGTGSVTRGYIAFDTDKTVVPPTQRLKDRTMLDSFSLAIARATNEAALRDDQWTAKMFAAFIRPEVMQTVSAGDVLRFKNTDDLRNQVTHSVVLIGGAWHALGYKTGERLIDSYETPVGAIPGVLVHANYVEAVLDRRVVIPLNNWFLTAGECFFGVLLAIVLNIKRLPLKVLFATALIGLPVLLSIVAPKNFLFYFDVLLIDLMILLKVAFEKVSEWYANHRRWLRYEAEHAHLATGTDRGLLRETL